MGLLQTWQLCSAHFIIAHYSHYLCLKCFGMLKGKDNIVTIWNTEYIYVQARLLALNQHSMFILTGKKHYSHALW